jgi:mannan endo-1,4-beta-mannosidase
MMRKDLVLTMGLLCTVSAYCYNASFTINTSLDTATISPYIYGSNAQSDDPAANITAMRQGGNRLTGYNWENNASSAGTDWNNSSDNYMGGGLVLGKSITDFADLCRSKSCFSVVTLQMAGFVAKDKKGTVSQAETAPSARWTRISFSKPTPYSLTPDTTDTLVYIDELVNFLVSKYHAASAGGVSAYDMDNEAALWSSTHPRIHPVAVTCSELLSKTIQLATAVKAIDGSAEIFGPVAYGFSEYQDLQGATDWSTFKGTRSTFLQAYLDEMRIASTTAGKRLLDVLDLHWYPEAIGGGQRIVEGDNSDSCALARVQAPRSLWDSTYKENSWIGQWFSPVALIPNLKGSISRYYAGTKLGFTEYDYGGHDHISGGIAEADVLGIFGKYGVHMASFWGTVNGFVSAGFRIFRNYDGNKSTFGSVSVRAQTTDIANSSIYASYSGTPGTVHVVVINRSLTDALNGSFSITSPVTYRTAAAWQMSSSDTVIRRLSTAPTVSSNSFTCSVPAMSVTHLVLSDGSAVKSSRSAAATSRYGLTVHSDAHGVRILYDCVGTAARSLELYGGDGRLLRRQLLESSTGSLLLGRTYAVGVVTAVLRDSAGLVMARRSVILPRASVSTAQ